MTSTKPGRAIKPLLDEAAAAGLTVERRKGTWVVTAPGTGMPPVFIGNNVDAPRSLNNIRAAIRRMVKAMPAPTETSPAPAAPEWTMPDTWSIPDLIAYAREQGITVQPTDGGLRIATPAHGHAQAVAQVIRTHEAAVRNALENPHMPPATVEIDTADLFYDDAYTVWECLRDEAKAQGDQPAPDHPGGPGVLWAGARDNAMAALSPEWQPSYRAALAKFLAACGAMTGVRRGRAPIWRIAAVWPEQAARRVRAESLSVAEMTEPEVKVELKPDADSPLAILARIKARVDAAEQRADAESARADEWQARAEAEKERADKAETRVAELEAENADLTGQLDQVRPQLDELAQIKAAFRVLEGDSR